VAGVPGLTVTARVLGALLPQTLFAVTLMFPFCPALPDVTVTEVFPLLEVIVHVGGTVHVYEVAPGTADMLYVRPVTPGHSAIVPVMGPGTAGRTVCVLITAVVPKEVHPEALRAVTV
jgi:hypothetical protein